MIWGPSKGTRAVMGVVMRTALPEAALEEMVAMKEANTTVENPIDRIAIGMIAMEGVAMEMNAMEGITGETALIVIRSAKETGSALVFMVALMEALVVTAVLGVAVAAAAAAEAKKMMGMGDVVKSMGAGINMAGDVGVAMGTDEDTCRKAASTDCRLCSTVNMRV